MKRMEDFGVVQDLEKQYQIARLIVTCHGCAWP